eukprot:ctg_2806.g525
MEERERNIRAGGMNDVMNVPDQTPVQRLSSAASNGRRGVGFVAGGWATGATRNAREASAVSRVRALQCPWGRQHFVSGHRRGDFFVLRSTRRSPTSCPLPSLQLSSSGSNGQAVIRTSREPVRVNIRPTRHDLATGRDPNRVRIFDTTCRDGEQSPGAALNAEEKLAIVRQLAVLGVDIVEAGFPAASNGDFEAVRRIADTVGNRSNPPIIGGVSAHSHLHRHVGHPHGVQATQEPRGGAAAGHRASDTGALAVRGRGVLRRGRHPFRPRVPRRGVPAGTLYAAAGASAVWVSVCGHGDGDATGAGDRPRGDRAVHRHRPGGCGVLRGERGGVAARHQRGAAGIQRVQRHQGHRLAGRGASAGARSPHRPHLRWVRRQHRRGHGVGAGVCECHQPLLAQHRRAAAAAPAAQRVVSPDRDAAGARARSAQWRRDPVGTRTRRPRPERGQLSGRMRGRRAAGGGDRERHRRARRQRRPGGGGDGAVRAPTVLRAGVRPGRGGGERRSAEAAHQRGLQGDRQDQPYGVQPDRHDGRTQQGHRRQQRVPARVGHPSARLPAQRLDLLHHGRATGGRDHAGDIAGQAERAGGVPLAPGGARLRVERRRAEPGVSALQGAGGPQSAMQRGMWHRADKVILELQRSSAFSAARWPARRGGPRAAHLARHPHTPALRAAARAGRGCRHDSPAAPPPRRTAAAAPAGRCPAGASPAASPFSAPAAVLHRWRCVWAGRPRSAACAGRKLRAPTRHNASASR